MSEKTSKEIWGRFAGRCAICRKSLIHEGDDGERSLIGEIAHIVGDKVGAARGVSSMSAEERNAPANLMLLCRDHHKIVDDNPEAYDVEQLRALRAEYLNWLGEQLTPDRRWKIAVSAFSFLNVPRLGEYAQREGFRIAHPGPPAGLSLHEMGWDLNALMEAFRATLEAMQFASVPAEEVAFAHEDYVGRLISFDRLRLRTRNIPFNRPTGGRSFPFSGDLDSDPHVYHRFADWTLVMLIEPTWITTSTAYTLFRPSGGHTVFTGLARITNVDLEEGVMTATALAMGQPDGPPSRKPPEPEPILDFSALEDDVTKARDDIWHGNPEHCDFCGRSLAQARYMVDGPIRPRGPWGCMCGECYAVSQLPLGAGLGQLYRRDVETWRLVGGYPIPLDPP